jgi:hypothetical protein
VNPDYLRELLRVESDGPYWTERPRRHFKTERDWLAWNAAFSGKRAGANGGRRITIDGKRFSMRRVLAAIETGTWSDGRQSTGTDGLPETYGELRRMLERECRRMACRSRR